MDKVTLTLTKAQVLQLIDLIGAVPVSKMKTDEDAVTLRRIWRDLITCLEDS